MRTGDLSISRWPRQLFHLLSHVFLSFEINQPGDVVGKGEAQRANYSHLAAVPDMRHRGKEFRNETGGRVFNIRETSIEAFKRSEQRGTPNSAGPKWPVARFQPYGPQPTAEASHSSILW